MTVRAAVTDTHALVWYALGRKRRLGPRARRLFDAAAAGRAVIHVPTLVLVEVLEATRKGVIQPQGGAAAWVRGLFGTGSFFPADLTTAVVLRGESLHGVPEQGDRLIAATAAVLDLPLVSRDPALAAAGVELIW